MSVLAVVALALVVLFLLGMPIFASLAIASFIALMTSDILPLSVVHNSLFDGLNLFPLLAIPCFIVAGSIMEQGNITNQIIDVMKQLVGRVYGGLGMVTILACMFFAAISGSGPGTVAAVGSILIPAMLKNGYSKDYAAAVASSGGTLGILIPPSNPMIIYAILGNLSITAMFTAGFVPGAIVAFAQIVTAWALARKHGFRDMESPPFNFKHFLKTCFRGSFALLTPVIILGSIYSGYATPVEASIVAIAWALFVGGVINRSLSGHGLYTALLDGAMVCGAVLIIVGTSTLFGKILTYEEAPLRLAKAIMSISTNKVVVLLMIAALLYFLGMFMETLSTIIIVAPVLLPVATQLDINHIHLGIIMVVTNEVALLSPPLGVNLFVSSRIANVSLERLSVSVLPYILALTVCIVLFILFPEIILFLPRMFNLL
ncbi:TRAP transporter large permease [Desulfovibrio litoralis]|uniref:C4-dicarboxylate transporter, DctM subunit n=1 Tax=Desulfovibrio litoralis DSM 11393 TaxID=1121455 RepID=A0A1M7T3Q6_9BACT|nr:TRAP transporter large permease [Desulfovibrio litoralis]SHN65383.1 C4-dicarboxylate transporter, DctM subunit [Desulfovibrio litoralis DSM 11393]